MSRSVSVLHVTVGECMYLSESEYMNVCMLVSVNECERMPECVRCMYELLCVRLSIREL